MRGNRTLILVAGGILLVIVLLAVGYFVVLPMLTGGGGGETVEETPTEFVPVEYTEIVVAVQNIPLGMEISVDDFAIELQQWPNDYLPYEYYTSLEEVDGKFARMTIPRGMPVMPDMIGQPGGMLNVSGSAAALFAPEDRVAYAIPMDTQGAVAWALRPGDHVDVIAAIGMVAMSSESVTEGVKQFTYLEEPEMPGQTSLFGRFELLPNGRWAAIYAVNATSNLVPNMFVQLTVQDAVVWHIGVWEDTTQQQTVEATPAAAEGDTEGLLGSGAEAAATPPPAAQEFRDIEPITLLVNREDALVLKYLTEMGADLDLVLRPAGFTDSVIQTQPVWYRYVLDKYQLPNAMPDAPVGPSSIRIPLEVPLMKTPEPEE